MNRTLFSAALVLALGLVATALVAGPLEPSLGPVASTYKTLSEVEPRIAVNETNTPGDATALYVISQPGSYYLTGDMQGVAGKHGIVIAASDVILDLNGFTLRGAPSSGSLDGVNTPAVLRSGITVRNGSVVSWGGPGVNLGTVQYATVVGVNARGNGWSGTGSGIRVGQLSSVTDSRSGLNAGHGIEAQARCMVKNSFAWQNGLNGIEASSGAQIVGCTSDDNSASGINVGASSLVIDCVANVNDVDGITVGSRTVVRGNLCSGNSTDGTGAGIRVTGSDNRIEANTCLIATRGILIEGTGNIVMRNTCSGNGTNWSIVAGNAVAPIVQATTNSSAINGSTFSGSLGSTDPNANFAY